MTRTNFSLLTRIAFWLALAFAYVMAIVPHPERGIEFHNDKANHVLAFLVLSVLARFGWHNVRAWTIAPLLMAFGAFIEISQAMPLIHRDAEFSDFVADALAVVVGLVIGSVLMLAINRRWLREA